MLNVLFQVSFGLFKIKTHIPFIFHLMGFCLIASSVCCKCPRRSKAALRWEGEAGNFVWTMLCAQQGVGASEMMPHPSRWLSAASKGWGFLSLLLLHHVAWGPISLQPILGKIFFILFLLTKNRSSPLIPPQRKCLPHKISYKKESSLTLV